MNYFCDLDAREVRELFPGVRAKTFWGKNMLLSVLEMDPGVHVPAHSHPHEQSGTVIEGTFEMTIGGQTRTLGPGGPDTVRAMDIFSPVREEYK